MQRPANVRGEWHRGDGGCGVTVDVLTGLAAILVLGVGVQWLARVVRVPALVLLLLTGIVAGEVGLVEPQNYLGDALYPVIALAVGVLLFDAGLGLRVRDLGAGARGPVIRLVTLGVLVTWLLASVTAGAVLGLESSEALLLGAVVVVSGPTVVGPLLKVARPREPVRAVLLWEGVVVDPIGAALGVAILHSLFIASDEGRSLVAQLAVSAVAGVVAGAVGAVLVVLVLRHFLVPDDLVAAVGTTIAVAAFAAAELVHDESGLFATTAMGAVLANQRYADVSQIREFGETVGVFVIGGLFILLAARVNLADMLSLLPETLVIAGVLVLLVRPLVAVLATWRAPGLELRDRVFVAALAPRGVVAAATAAVFTLVLEQRGAAFVQLAPVVYGLIIVLAVVYALSVPLARLIGVARPPPRGIALVGSEPWVLSLADQLARLGVRVLVVSPDAGEPGRPDLPFDVYTGNLHELPASRLLDDLQAVLVAAGNSEREQVAVGVAVEVLGRGRTYVLPADERPHARPLGTRRACGEGVTRSALTEAARAGAAVVVLSPEQAVSDASALPLARVRDDGTVGLAPDDLAGRRLLRGGGHVLAVASAAPQA